MNSGAVVDHLCRELRKFRCDPNVDCVLLSMQMMSCMEKHPIYDLKDLREGQIAVFLSSILTSVPTNIIKLPKSVQFISMQSAVVNSAHIIWPMGLLGCNARKTAYGEAIAHVFRAMMAMYKVFGKDIGKIMMRAIYETGAILADEWKMTGSNKKKK